jgi:hypothetical protein
MPSAPTMKILCAAMDERDERQRRRMLHKVFDGYNASSDWPGFASLEDILDMFPNIKVILNKRKISREWQSSITMSLSYFSTWRYHILTYWIPICRCHFKMYRTYMRLAKARYGVDDIFSEDCCNRHNQWVRDVVAARGKDVFEWEPSDGWPPLCEYLGYGEPDEVFPRVNETIEIERLKGLLVKKGLQAWAGVLTVIAFCLLLVIATSPQFKS